jgi:hypothetical protein
MPRTMRWRKGTWFVRLLVVAIAVAAYVSALPTAFGLDGSSSSASYGYAYGNAYGKERVTLCHSGTTLSVALPSLAAHLAHGDTVGPCP